MSHKYYKPAKSRLQRSELAVPGSSPQMFEKALNSNADYIFLDLEDAVSPNDKIAARANVIKALNEIDWNGKGKTISVSTWIGILPIDITSLNLMEKFPEPRVHSVNKFLSMLL